MNNKETIDVLNSLIQLDYDAVQCYDQAIDEIEDPMIRQQFELFRSDHERHFNNLSSLVRQRGGQPPERSRSFKGFFLEGFTSIRSQSGTEGALKAMETNEKMTNDKYSDAVSKDLPMDVKRQVETNYQDERRHLEYIERMLIRKAA